MLNSLKDESLFTSLISRQGGHTTKNSRILKSPREEYIKKRVVSQLTQNRNNAGAISRTSPRDSASPDGKRYNMKNQQEETTDYISLNRRVSLLSRNMGKEATMGSTAARNHSNAMWSNSFPLTSLKEKDMPPPDTRMSAPNQVDPALQ